MTMLHCRYYLWERVGQERPVCDRLYLPIILHGIQEDLEQQVRLK